MGERPAAVGDLRLATIVVNALDMDRAAAFWAETLGYDRQDKVGPDHQYTMLSDPAGHAPSVLIQRTEKVAPEIAPVHIDLYTRERDQHIERLLKLGATRAEWDYPERHDFVVLRDTEGNAFCVIDAD